MNITVLLIAAFLPLPIVLFMILRSGSFGKGSLGALMKLFFLGLAAAVPAFLMEMGILLLIDLFLNMFGAEAAGGDLAVIGAILRAVIAVALIEEGWKHFVLRKTTWNQMTMETIADGIAASAVVGAGFSAVMYGAWQAANLLIPADMGPLRDGMPGWLRAGAVGSFLFALLYIFSHFGFSGFMGAIYGIAKNSEQKQHNKRAGMMLVMSCLLPVLAHGACAALIVYGVDREKVLWFAVGLAAETLLAVWMAAELSKASDAAGVDNQYGHEAETVDFGDSEEFAAFAESGGAADNEEKPQYAYAEGQDRDEAAPEEENPQEENPQEAEKQEEAEKPEE